jgi:flagellar biosynthesis chaperone FliJ|tara:strand:+ start:6807 stop:6986 length:180 start_codon:yes stop_codon:yes gene_type:complete
MKKRDPKAYQNLQQRLSMKELREKKRQESAEHDSHSMATTIFVVVLILVIIGAAIYLTT